jgi:hypothetical protein
MWRNSIFIGEALWLTLLPGMLTLFFFASYPSRMPETIPAFFTGGSRFWYDEAALQSAKG